MLRSALAEQGGGIPLVEAGANHQRDYFGDQLAVMQTERVRLAQRLAHGRVARAGALIGPDKHIAQQLYAVQFINAQHTVNIGAFRNVHKRQWAEVIANQRDICRQARHPLVHVLERLKVSEVHKREKCLFKRIGNRGGGIEDLLEIFVNPLWQLQRMIDAAVDARADASQAAAGLRIGEQVVCQETVQIQHRISV